MCPFEKSATAQNYLILVRAQYSKHELRLVKENEGRCDSPAVIRMVIFKKKEAVSNSFVSSLTCLSQFIDFIIIPSSLVTIKKVDL